MMLSKYLLRSIVLMAGFCAATAMGQGTAEATANIVLKDIEITERIIKLENESTPKIEELIALYADGLLPLPKPDGYEKIEVQYTRIWIGF